MAGLPPVAVGVLVTSLLGGAVWAVSRSMASITAEGTVHEALGKPTGPTVSVTPGRLAAGLVVGGLTLVVTHWPVLAAVVGLLVARWEQLLGDAAAEIEQARVAAIAKWLEDLRDLLRGSSMAAEEALDQAAQRCGDAISAEMGEFLACRRRGVRMDEALASLGRGLRHPLSDAAVAAIGLVLSGTVGSGRLFGTVDALAGAARAELMARERIDRTRATYGSTMKRLVVIGGLLVVYLAVAGRDLVRPYDSGAGQVALLVPLGMWAGCVVWLRSLRRYGGGR